MPLRSPIPATTAHLRFPPPFLIPSLTLRPFIARHASTSAIPPESPLYIDIPQPPQQQARYQPYVKGVLPKPREIFPRKGPKKISTAYIAAVTPEPQPKTIPPPPSSPTTDLTAWKARQSASRRQNLRSALHELHTRKERDQRLRKARFEAREAETRALRNAPETDAERLTKPTTLSSQTATGFNHASAEYRAAYIAQKRRNYEAHYAEIKARRRDDLHKLYMSAGDFIITEEQMREEVERVFEDKTQFDTDRKAGTSIWDLGLPKTVGEMLGPKSNEEQKETLRQRMRKMAEELTGGKIVERED